MKKIKFMFAVVLSLVLMTGCIKYDATIEVKNDKSLSFKIIYALDKSFIETMKSYDTSDSSSSTELLKDDQKKNLEKQGYTVKDYEDDKYKGSEITLNVKNIDEVSVEGDFNLDLSKMGEDTDAVKLFVVKKGFLKNTYKANYKFQNSASSSSSSDDSTIDSSALTNSMDMKFNIVLPNGATKNNATTVNGNTYTWDLTKASTTDLDIEFEMYNMNNIYYIIGGVVLAIVLVVGIVVMATRKKA